MESLLYRSNHVENRIDSCSSLLLLSCFFFSFFLFCFLPFCSALCVADFFSSVCKFTSSLNLHTKNPTSQNNLPMIKSLFMEEVSFWYKIDHPNIVKVINSKSLNSQLQYFSLLGNHILSH